MASSGGYTFGLAQLLDHYVWRDPDEAASPARRWAVRSARVAWFAGQGFMRDHCALRAAALTYASLLALVPVMAVSFAFLRGMGWSGDRLEAVILARFTLMSPEAVDTIVSYIDNTSIAGLGVIGAVFVVISSVSVMAQVEQSLDVIWGNAQPRGVVRRTADYFALLVGAPILLAAAMSVTAALKTNSMLAWLASLGGVGVLMHLLTSLVPYLVVSALFTFLYTFVPNARVRWTAAAAGGIVAGIGWQLTQSAYLAFQFGMANYNAIYGTLAQLPVLMVWMYTSWTIVLAGAEVSATVQNLTALSRQRRNKDLSIAERETLALALVTEMAAAAYEKRPVPTLESLSAALDVPVRDINEMVCTLSDAGLVHLGGEEQARVFLSLSPGSIRVTRVLAALRGEKSADRRKVDSRVRDLLSRLYGAREQSMEGMTLADLVDR
ncbi:MAG TPA: YihY/virulence factor BrkB family protein [Candidatus Limnocylindrales bacterium]|nr:YihY/virulence factor BrkB family protein [Candidatus Limnocylindrales bacterium]